MKRPQSQALPANDGNKAREVWSMRVMIASAWKNEPRSDDAATSKKW